MFTPLIYYTHSIAQRVIIVKFWIYGRSSGGMPALLIFDPNALAFFLMLSGRTSTVNAVLKRGSFFSFSLGIYPEASLINSLALMINYEL